MPLNTDDIKEGQDVFFRCEVEANPQVYKISWIHRVRLGLSHNNITKTSPQAVSPEPERGGGQGAGHPDQRLQPRAAARQQGPGRGLQLRRQQPRGGRSVQHCRYPDQM